MSVAFGAFVLCVALNAPMVGELYTLPDGELMSNEFAPVWGNSTVDLRADTPGAGVHYLLTLSRIDSGKTGIGDPWPTDPAAGLLRDPVQGHYTSLAPFSGMKMMVGYLTGPPGSTINVAMYMNTGLTGASGRPANDLTNDTFWGGSWVEIRQGETKMLTLDFDAAEGWNIADNKSPHTGGGLRWPNGGIYQINERDRYEVTNIGFQIADFNGDALGYRIELSLNVIPEPATLALCMLGMAGLAVTRRRSR